MNVAIVAAAGQGTRAGGSRAKQFREISGTPIIIHTLRRFEQCAAIGEVLVVVPAGEAAEVLALVAEHGLRKVARVVAGGATRTESVWRGLQMIRAATAKVVAVHDGVRPFVTPEEIASVVGEAERSGAAILAARAVDTIKEVEDGRVVRTLERARLWHAQTPQCFRYDILRRAYERALAEKLEATDDSALVERLGASISIVEGGARNIKITRPEDIALAEIMLKRGQESGAGSQK
ncbi:MAG TPA: 2-C-methyl-D-erythritol 4-phosphate cytidylyltransferase [Pyrinomonadaceae bacterium]|jgi:2-C-methyl-D-erythritol 4-phosphate cytidylyltransferase|nr:2-C-methyl-D-erythritol 4-phosphate cytidylyltransferase [Pyrinomonadaceae bacterium]